MKRTAIAIFTLVAIGSTLFVYSAGAQQQTLLMAKLNGAKEVSSEGEKGVGDEDGTGGSRIRLFRTENRVCFRLNWSNIGAPTAAHIHEAGPDAAGPVVVGLFQSEGPLPGTLSGVRGCVADVEQEVIDAIRKNPAGYYVNVHNTDFPGGAIRGQLKRPPRD